MKVLEELKKNCNHGYICFRQIDDVYHPDVAMELLGYKQVSTAISGVLSGVLKNHKIELKMSFAGGRGFARYTKLYECDEKAIEHLFYYATTSKAKELRMQALEEFYTDVRQSNIIHDRDLTKLFLQVAETGCNLKLFQDYIYRTSKKHKIDD